MTNKLNNDYLSKKEVANELRIAADNLEKSFTNKQNLSKQGPSIHIDQESLEEIKILERMLKLKHHNETIRLLIYFYINNQNAERQKQFQTIKQIEQQM